MAGDEPNGSLLARVDVLVEATARVETEVRADRESRHRYELAVEERMRTNREAAATANRSSKIAITVAVFTAVALVVALVIGALTFSRLADETHHRCDQVRQLADSVEGIVAVVNRPNPTRTPEQQQAIDAFIANAHDQLETARAC